MSKYDCSNCLDYEHEHNRMCIKNECDECTLNGFVGHCDVPDMKDKIDTVQKWSDENPDPEEKTILEDFKKKFPNYARRTNDDIPLACADYLYKIPHVKGYTCNANTCRDCWSTSLREAQNER